MTKSYIIVLCNKQRFLCCWSLLVVKGLLDLEHVIAFINICVVRIVAMYGNLVC
jgi:hypothetical protein